jgi:hypothetical protein
MLIGMCDTVSLPRQKHGEGARLAQSGRAHLLPLLRILRILYVNLLYLLPKLLKDPYP